MDKLLSYQQIKINEVQSRYLSPEMLYTFLSQIQQEEEVVILGHSVERRPIHAVRLGSGPVRVLIWSQMHGNESTTTKAVLDLINALRLQESPLLNSLELCIVPMLNPDGAHAYTRLNANAKDLNRDALDLSQPESILLRKVFDDFKPHFCFNLHDQRTIYSVGDSPVPATLSLLAPALDTERSFTGNRIKAAQLSSLVAASLKDVIGIARYNDTFNQNCAGDYFQSRGVPTVLFEAGHFPGDYQRETTRFYVWQALLTALDAISSRAYEKFSLDAYVEIPENQKRFADILIRNAQITHPDLPANCTLGIQYEEKLSEGHVEFCPRIAELGESGRRFGHLEWDLSRPRDMKKLIKSEELFNLLKQHHP